MPDDPTEAEIIDRVSDEIVARVTASHPTVRGRLMRQLVALHTAQALGLERPSGQIRDHELGAYLGLSRQSIGETRATALAKAWRAYRSRHSA